MTKRHTRHSRRGFYPPKSEESTLPGLIYVASDGPEIDAETLSQNGSEMGLPINGDKDVVNDIKLLEEEPDSFPQALWKSLWKSAIPGPQMAEIYGLVALCTHFVQSFFIPKSSYFSEV
ncbi:MAG TPA: hypothetical protein VE262_03815 [Blastocatellia bacterium]|nr:hypothetical protein [Blastocatellia bacterium]